MRRRLFLFVLWVCLISNAFADYTFSKKDVYTVTKINALNELVLDVDVGEITVKTWDEDFMKFIATKRAETKKGIESIAISYKAKGGSYIFKSEIKKYSLKNKNLDLEVFMPKRVNLYIDCGIGDIEINDFESNFDIDCNIGDVTFNNLKLRRRGDDKVEMNIGEINIELNKDLPPFTLIADTTIGDIKTSKELDLKPNRSFLVGSEINASYKDGKKKVSLKMNIGEIKLKYSNEITNL